MGLSLTVSQSNDAKTITLTDNSTWNDGDLPLYTAITSASLQISYKTPDLESAISTIDIQSVFDAAGTEDDLIFTITSTDLGLGSGEQLPDGIYTIAYQVSDGATTWAFDSDLETLFDAIIRAEVYKKVSLIATKYYCSNNYFTKPIDDIILLKALYDSMISSAYVAKQEEILTLLEVLQRQTQ